MAEMIPESILKSSKATTGEKKYLKYSVKHYSLMMKTMFGMTPLFLVGIVILLFLVKILGLLY